MQSVWNQLWPNLAANILWVIPAYLIHRASKAVKALTGWVESVKNMEESIRANTIATRAVKDEFHEWRLEVANRLLNLTDRVATLEDRK